MAIREHGLFRRCEAPSPDVAKGGCYYSGDAGPGVDTGILIEFEGTLYFGLNAIREMAEVAGFTLDTEGIETQRRLAEAQYDIALYQWKVAELEASLNAVGIAVALAAQPKP